MKFIISLPGRIWFLSGLLDFSSHVFLPSWLLERSGRRNTTAWPHSFSFCRNGLCWLPGPAHASRISGACQATTALLFPMPNSRPLSVFSFGQQRTGSKTDTLLACWFQHFLSKSLEECSGRRFCRPEKLPCTGAHQVSLPVNLYRAEQSN